ncbi:MAG TPA: hypothetical protein VHO25_06150, partial [Polyangiaceae bacterium]|nr:hypothetical protein [Polyangiaceae bacterium]
MALPEIDESIIAPPPASDTPGVGLLAVRQPLSSRARFWVGLCAFLLPLLVWCVISYVPFIWHPQVLIESPGDSAVPGTYAYLAEGQRVERAEFAARNQELAAAGAELARGTRVNPIFLPPPHEV